ncbi:bifunctional phosphoribosyl-AMP cyclohydrolase/phosphoribosyl-ATP diphosphatase HisIE [Sphingomonas sp. LHG3406-1]|uniref:bifunctional phosphoribosyl-AMP cyclohydrolase/phosphoribosyl-ATP diphosphatase HisIE n=1 Tax=Sphingomonas sp. LHG3406-1 TaxID=2804617 RepID=UPI00261EDCCB|nr:bifunctional phosphoribosyl-AMP cyclohydrolase/phosphoribosyl-ATP diphosphatase HisIE [Sphingomonas sp. LHG3406-1]
MIDPDRLAWDKMDGLIPAIVQDSATGQLLMVGYMNRQALAATLDSGEVTFFSRSKDRLWRKGETSGNVLKVASLHGDCDGDALLVLAEPAGPTCHLGTDSCFGTEAPGAGWLGSLERIVAMRAGAAPEDSYTARLLAGGPGKAAQKVGEEGVEVALAAVSRDAAGLREEAGDLLFHLLVTLRSRDVSLASVIETLRQRHKPMRTGKEQSA